MNRSLLVLLIALSALVGCGRNSQESSGGPVLRFTAIPDQNTTELMQRFTPFADHLAQELGIKVEYVPARDYQASVEMFRNGDIMLAWFGGLTGVQARSMVPGSRAIAQGQSDPNYFSYVIANASTGLSETVAFPQAIANHTFTFGSVSSTSGRLMPEYFIRTITGKSPGEFFNEPVGFSGSHDKTCELVEAGRFEVGVVNYKVYDRRVAEGTTDPEVCRIIWRTPTYADYNFTAHPAMELTFGGGFTAKLREVLLNISDPALLAALPREKLISASNEEFADITAVARELGMVR